MSSASQIAFYPRLADSIAEARAAAAQLSEERRGKLGPLVDYILSRARADQPARLNFICTHNSRRSHLCQLWAQTAAAFWRLPQVETYSGGTEVTAMNPRSVAALERAGFGFEKPEGDNPRYLVTMTPGGVPALCFSKVFDDPHNPQGEFAAVMTCTHADQNCPVIPGATRLSLPYKDPKAFDDTPEEAERYDERSRQIAAEMFYVMQQVAEAA